MFSLESRPPVAEAPDQACIVGRAVNGAQAFDRWEVVEAFAMFVREGSLPVWKASDRDAVAMSRGPETPARGRPRRKPPRNASGSQARADTQRGSRS